MSPDNPNDSSTDPLVTPNAVSEALTQEFSGPPLDSSQLLGHPIGLFFLFFAELWERFSFYGMRALLVLYLTKDLFSEIANGKEVAYEVYAAYGALVYFTPAIGGMLADRVIGHKNSIMLGAALMTLGHFTMAFESTSIFYLSLGLLIIGNGFFKPNISSLVGGLYPEGDARREGGFTIFYLGINLGAFLAPLVCGYLGEAYGWHYGFSAAGFGMFVGLLLFGWGRTKGVYGVQGEQPKSMQSYSVAGLNIRYWIYLASLLSVPVFGFLVQKSELELLFGAGLMQCLLFGLLGAVLVFLTYICVNSDRVTRDRLIVIGVLTLFVTVFWAFFEQAGSSLTLFAEEQVRLVGLNASQTNAINPFYIIVLAIPFSMMWNRLETGGKNPGTMVKFGLGIGQLGAGFLVFAMSARFVDTEGRVSMIFLLIGYLLITSGELFLSPIGLSKVTELSPAKLVAFMMGVWFLSSSFAHYIAGVIAKLTSGAGHGESGEAVGGVAADADLGLLGRIAKSITGAVPQDASVETINLLNYTAVFAQVAVVSFVVAAIALIISPVIKKMMHGIR